MNSKIYMVDSCELYSFKDLRELLIQRIEEDTIQNREDKDIIKGNLLMLRKLNDINYGFNEKTIIDELKLFGYDIVSVNEIDDILFALKLYFNNNNYETLEKECEHLRKETKEIFK